MQLVDTHCHIQSIGAKQGERHTQELWAKAEQLSIQNVLDRAMADGVSKMICVGCELEDSQLAIDVAAEHANIWASIGIHPHEASNFAVDKNAQDKFKALSKQAKVIAVGECGLDYYYEHSPRDQQIEILNIQLELASQQALPVIFHVREAFDDFWSIVNNFPNLHAVLHSFTDNLVNLDEALKRGFYIGVNGISTFAKKPEQIEMYKRVPLSNLLLETDAPFLTPVPFRGNINEPNMVAVIAKHLAEIRNENLNDLAAATTANATKLFGV